MWSKTVKKHAMIWWTEFELDKVGLSYERPQDFAFYKTGKASFIYLVYRSLTMAVILGAMLYDWIMYGDDFPKWFLYYTNWGFLLLALHMIILWGIAVWHYLQPGFEYSDMPAMYRITWVLHNIIISSTCATPSFVVFFWIVVLNQGYPWHALSIVYHGVNALIITVDFSIMNIPVRLVHFFHGQVFCLIYCFFTVIYWIIGLKGENGLPCIYELLDWENDPLIAIVLCVLILLLVPVCQILMFASALSRTYFRKKCCPLTKLKKMDSNSDSVSSSSSSDYSCPPQIPDKQIVVLNVC